MFSVKRYRLPGPGGVAATSVHGGARLSDWPASRRRGAWRRSVPWRRLAAGSFVAFALVAAVSPLRQMALGITARLILLAASPTAPAIADFQELPEVTTVHAVDGSVLAELHGGERRVPVTLDSLPEPVWRAVLAAEDEHFYEHDGVDSGAVFRALLRTTRGEPQGGSTISQQLAKINYTAGERTLFRKFREVQYVTKLEERYSKDELLERYLNQVYFGERAYGIRAAAQTFFGVEAAQLTPGQAATLAGKIRSPERLDPRTRPDAVRERRDQVLANMRREGWLTEPEYRAAVAAPLEVVPPRAEPLAEAPHFVEYVKREAQSLASLGPDPATRTTRLVTGGYRVETTLDPRVYEATVDAVRQHLGAPDDPITAAATVEPGTGAIRSLFGGLDFSATQFDVASLGTRQPGSAFKPFVYLAALRDGIDPRSSFDGTSPLLVPCYSDKPVQNYGDEDAGTAIDVDSALAASVNVVFVQLGCLVGVEDVERAAQDAGVPPDATESQGAIFLGGLDRGVSALTMAAAYATFAADGTYAAPFAITRIVDRAGTPIYQHDTTTRAAFRSEEVRVLNAAMLRVVREGTGRAAGIGRPMAGKTGTTQDNIDAWFAGYTPQLATAVWVGFEPKRPMASVRGRHVTGGSFPALIFGSLMRAALDGVAATPIPTASPDALGLTLVTTTTTSTTTTTEVPAPEPAPPVVEVSSTTTPPTPTPPTTKRPATTTTTPSTTTTTTSTPATTSTTKRHPRRRHQRRRAFHTEE